MADQRKAPVCYLQWNDIHYTHQLQRHLPPTQALNVCDAAVADSPVLQHYLHIKHNGTYVNVMQFSEFRPWQKFLSVTVSMCLLSVIGANNSVLNEWVMEDR